MFAAAVDQCRDTTLAKNIQSAADQWETFVHEIAHGRDEIEFAVEPGLDGVLVRGSHVGEMPGLKRTNVCVNDLGGGDGFGASGAGVRQGEPCYARQQKDCRGSSKPAPGTDRRGAGVCDGDFDFSANLFAQFRRSGFIKLSTLKRRTHGLRGPKSRRTLAAAFEMAFEFGGAHGVEFAVEVSVQERPGKITAHGAPPAEQVARARAADAG